MMTTKQRRCSDTAGRTEFYQKMAHLQDSGQRERPLRLPLWRWLLDVLLLLRLYINIGLCCSRLAS